MKHLIFVYGTLMKNQRNHHYMKNCKYLYDAVLNDYCLYDVSNYPGAFKKKGKKVYGEVYEVDEESKKQMDVLEDEGNLYKYIMVKVDNGEDLIDVGFYEYIDNGKQYPYRDLDGKWFEK